ncbi:MAG: efflux RND transporter permease subunit [Flavobacteriales bacterium]|nr:efflux RND transporter permease subunit [Flavobacteriales bacterium]
MRCNKSAWTPDTHQHASEWKNGLAWVIIVGLPSSLLLTVFLVPVVYYAVDALKEQ